ncbi:hypothetical protein SAMN05443246_0392 [Paenibacillus sp. GP183]|nr:hypothetical protein SAMN05443246_0392 [Paenibacillus sp. GP183]
MPFNVQDWERVNSYTYRNKSTRLCKSKVTFSLEEQYKLEIRDFILIKSGALLIKKLLNQKE